MKRLYALFLVATTSTENSFAMLSSSRLFQAPTRTWSAIKHAATTSGITTEYDKERDETAVTSILYKQIETLWPESPAEEIDQRVQTEMQSLCEPSMSAFVYRTLEGTIGLVKFSISKHYYRLNNPEAHAEILNLAVKQNYEKTGIKEALIQRALNVCDLEQAITIRMENPKQWHLEDYLIKLGFERFESVLGFQNDLLIKTCRTSTSLYDPFV
jgi:hypothetical protein